MFKELLEKFESIPATIIAGVCLLVSFIVPKFYVNIPIYLDAGWITVLICGLPILFSAIKKLIKNKGISKISSALLISVAMIAAIIIGDLFAAGEVAFIMAIGEILEDKTTDRAKKGLKKLIELAPQQGHLIKDGKEIDISAEEIKVGDILRVLPGETIPVDAVIIDGQTSVDQSVMTGESFPVDKQIGDDVFCGTINCFGSIDVRATKVGSDSSLSKLIRMVKDAEDQKAPMQRIADKWASWLVPVALLIAIITFFVTEDITRAVTVLVVFCPCALVLATPTAIMAAIGQATKNGIVIKSGEALEQMGKINAIAFDKTGTLTKGTLSVSDVIPLANIDNNELLRIAASCEAKSEHPLGKAIVAFSKEKNIDLFTTESFKMVAGKGIKALLSNSIIICGNKSYLEENGVIFPTEFDEKISNLQNEGKALVIVAKDNNCIGIIALSDVIKNESEVVISQLNKLKVKTVLLTGDNERAAQFISQKIGLKKIFANLLPENKVDAIIKMQNEGLKVCMVGDGVNDAPALKTADVGVAMGTMGSDIAVEAADIALMGDDISKITYLKRLSNATVNTVKFSIFLSLFINLLAIVLSFLGILTPTTGALVHNAGSCFVVLIAALLYDRKI